jgi:hypothetical protein
MDLSCLFCPVCPVSYVLFAVPCSEEEKLLKHELWVATKEHYYSKAPEAPGISFVDNCNVYVMGKNFRESLLLDRRIQASALKSLFENQMHRNRIREPFLLSCLPAAVLAAHMTFYSALAMQQRPNHLLFCHVREQVALAHAKAFLTANPNPTVQAFYTHMDQVFDFLPLGKAQKRLLTHPKDLILDMLREKNFASMPPVLFQKEVSTASKFDRFQDLFEALSPFMKHMRQSLGLSHQDLR